MQRNEARKVRDGDCLEEVSDALELQLQATLGVVGYGRWWSNEEMRCERHGVYVRPSFGLGG